MQVAGNILATMKGIFVLEKLAGKPIPFHGALHTPPNSENLLFFPLNKARTIFSLFQKRDLHL